MNIYTERRNLLEETLFFLDFFGKTESDVKWVGSYSHKVTWEDFKKAADVVYDATLKSNKEVAFDLIIVGDDWWITREMGKITWGWRFNTYPKEPKEFIKLNTVLTSNMQDLDWIEENRVK